MDNKNQFWPNYALTVEKKSEEVEMLYDEEYEMAVSRFEWEGGSVIGLRMNKGKKSENIVIEVDDPEWFVAPPFLEQPIMDWVAEQKSKKNR